MPRIIATLRRRIERAGAARTAAFDSGDMVAWKRHADRASTLRDALLSALKA
jgi:hypothetical protein